MRELYTTIDLGRKILTLEARVKELEKDLELCHDERRLAILRAGEAEAKSTELRLIVKKAAAWLGMGNGKRAFQCLLDELMKEQGK